MKRVLMLGRYDFSDHQGGVQYYADLLAKFLAQHMDVDLLVSSASVFGNCDRKGRLKKIAVGSLGIFMSVPVSLTFPFWSLWLVLTKKYDVVHFNFPDPLALISFLFLPKRSKWIMTWHSDVIRQKRALKFYQPLVRLFMKRIDAVTVSTPHHKESCEQLIDSFSGPVEVIPFGIESKKWAVKDEDRAKAQQIRKTVLRGNKHFYAYAFGRHIYYKGYEYLIRAIAKTENIHLGLGGSGPLTESFKRLVNELGIDDRVTFLGQVHNDDLKAYFLASDVFCFPSVDTSETFGYAQVEAMLTGSAVLCSNLGNGVNFVSQDKQTGLFMQPRDPDSIAEALNFVAQNPDELQKYKNYAQSRAFKLFTIEASGARTLDWYGSVESSSKSG